jgi:hypothetical protein
MCRESRGQSERREEVHFDLDPLGTGSGRTFLSHVSLTPFPSRGKLVFPASLLTGRDMAGNLCGGRQKMQQNATQNQGSDGKVEPSLSLVAPSWEVLTPPSE